MILSIDSTAAVPGDSLQSDIGMPYNVGKLIKCVDWLVYLWGIQKINDAVRPQDKIARGGGGVMVLSDVLYNL